VVRGPRPSEYCYGELRVVPRPRQRLRSVASPVEFIPPDRVVPGLSSGARGNPSILGGWGDYRGASEEEELFIFNDAIEGPRAPAAKPGRVTQA
jgi:hypothetical protein